MCPSRCEAKVLAGGKDGADGCGHRFKGLGLMIELDARELRMTKECHPLVGVL